MGIEKEFDALAADAISASEKEFFNDAMSLEDPVADETGDRSLEDMGKGLEGQHEEGEDEGNEDGAEQPLEAKAEGDNKDAEAERDDQGRFKPQAGKTETPAERALRMEMVSERDKRKSTEAVNTELQKRLDALEARLNQPATAAPTPKVEAAKEEIPDRWTDPDGYDKWHRNEILREVRTELQTNEQRRIAGSFEDAKAEHGPAFDEAYKTANSVPADHPAAAQIRDLLRSPNPGRAVMTWYKQVQAQREIGNDPAAYREKVATEAREALMKDPDFRKQVLANLQGEARGNGGGPARTATHLPPSLNSARGGSQFRGGSDAQSDSDIFAEITS